MALSVLFSDSFVPFVSFVVGINQIGQAVRERQIDGDSKSMRVGVRLVVNRRQVALVVRRRRLAESDHEGHEEHEGGVR